MESKLTMERILHYYRKDHLKSYRILPVYLLNSIGSDGGFGPPGPSPWIRHCFGAL